MNPFQHDESNSDLYLSTYKYGCMVMYNGDSWPSLLCLWATAPPFYGATNIKPVLQNSVLARKHPKFQHP